MKMSVKQLSCLAVLCPMVVSPTKRLVNSNPTIHRTVPGLYHIPLSDTHVHQLHSIWCTAGPNLSHNRQQPAPTVLANSLQPPSLPLPTALQFGPRLLPIRSWGGTEAQQSRVEGGLGFAGLDGYADHSEIHHQKCCQPPLMEMTDVECPPMSIAQGHNGVFWPAITCPYRGQPL